VILQEELHKPELARPILGEIDDLASQIRRQVKIMEVCGTHTVSIRRYGLPSLLPGSLELISGPGCPVCVTPAGYIDNALRLIEDHGAVVATYGDMLKVPGIHGGTLAKYSGLGKVKIVYSASDLLPLAEASRGPVVFLGVGFETTIPTVASVFLRADDLGVANLFLYPAFKTIVPALRALLSSPDRYIDGFLLPGHVSVILGSDAYGLLERPGGAPGAVTGFEPLDILYGILLVLRQVRRSENRVENAYPRAVRPQGNRKALEVMERLLEPSDDLWRGLGRIPGGGKRLRDRYGHLDAARRFDLPSLEDHDPPGCICHRVILGRATPLDCSLFDSTCRPDQPVGPCMVSSEGTCAAYLKYGGAG
jgi:hydrogenase expression/formation protein HypD